MTRKVRQFFGGVYDLGLHVAWCPEYRPPRPRRAVDARLEVMPDHVHLFVKHDPKSSPSYIANQFKGYSSRVLGSEFPHLKSRLPTLWSPSYFVASVGAVSAATVQQYIDSQWEKV